MNKLILEIRAGAGGDEAAIFAADLETGKKAAKSIGYWAEKLIKFKDLLGDQNIADIILVWSGFKPAALAELSCFQTRGVPRSKFEKIAGEFAKVLKNLGLVYKLHKNYPETRNMRTKYTCIAKDKRILKKITSALSEKNTKKRRLKTGMLLGYPKTAVAAFANNRSIDNRELPRSVLASKMLRFLNFRLSKDWRKELEYVKKRAKEIRRVSPKLYSGILGRPD